jgi:hypothetical protein
MAVRTQELQVLETVVKPVAVHVVQGHAQRLPTPLVDPTLLAAMLLQAGLQEPPLEVVAACSPAYREQILDRNRPIAGSDRASLYCLMP